MLSFESPDAVNGSVCDHTLCRITDERFPSPWLSMAGKGLFASNQTGATKPGVGWRESISTGTAGGDWFRGSFIHHRVNQVSG